MMQHDPELTELEIRMGVAVALLQRECHTNNLKWWQDPATGKPIDPYTPHLVGEKIMLVVTELAEAIEGHRKNKMDDHLPAFKSITVELADALIRIFDLAQALDLNVAGAFIEKTRYNATRLDHTHAARLAPGGKSY